MTSLPTEQFFDVVRALGFSAIVVDKRAESDEIREKAEAFAIRPGTQVFNDRDNTQTAILINAPAATARAMVRGSGWHAQEDDGERSWVWSSDRPTLALSPSSPGAGTCTTSLTLSSIRPMQVKVVDESGNLFTETSLRPGQATVVKLVVPASTTRVVLENGVAAAPPGNGDPRPMAILWERTGDQLPLCSFNPS